MTKHNENEKFLLHAFYCDKPKKDKNDNFYFMVKYKSKRL